MWQKYEPSSIRAPPDIRRARYIKRFSPWVRYPGYEAIKASDAETGEFMGFAGWHTPVHSISKFINLFRKEAVEECGFAEQEGWTDADVEEMWKGIDVSSWENDFGRNDRVRKEEMVNMAHW